MDCLDRFCSESGQKISLHKSSIAFSRDTKEETAMKISTVAKIPITANLGKYLGIPSITGRFHAGLFQDIMDRIDGKLNGWKTKLLSLAGRTVMAQAVLTTIPMYPMQSTLLPISLCNTIDKIYSKIYLGKFSGQSESSF